jgi:hypothetical protein
MRIVSPLGLMALALAPERSSVSTIPALALSHASARGVT